MYRGKSLGRARVEVFADHMETAVVEQTELETELLQAIRTREIDVAFQPVIDLPTGEVMGLEALARWTSPTRGVVEPELFVRLVESIGVVHALDGIVLRLAAEAMAQVPASVLLGVNVSARQFDQPGVVQHILATLADAGMSPDRLVVEVTETGAMRDPSQTAGVLERLRAEGIRVAIDDFGTGYSSLSYLQHFPVDSIKIDRSFVTGLDDERQRRIAGAVIALAHALDLRVVVEGIETPEQLAVLRELGADRGQGFHLGRPMAIDELLIWLSRQRVAARQDPPSRKPGRTTP
jgi:EAL domain-containing protein (putative c-di-GMP-specific phosphodiesterase class I)